MTAPVPAHRMRHHPPQSTLPEDEGPPLPPLRPKAPGGDDDLPSGPVSASIAKAKAKHGLLKLLVGTAVSCALLYLMFRDIDWRLFTAHLAAVDLRLPLAGVVALALAYALKLVRWHYMLRLAGSPIGLSGCARPFFIGFALNNLLPLRAGDIARVFAFRQLIGLPASRILVTLIIERLLDLLTLLGILALALLALHGVREVSGWANQMLLAAGLALLVLATTIIAILVSGRVPGTVARLAALAPGDLGPRFERALAQLRDGLLILSGRRALATTASMTITVWALESGVFVFSAMALAQPIDGAWLAMAAGNLGTLLPGAPGHLGTFDYFAMQGLVAFGAELAPAAAFALLAHLIGWLPVTLLGLAYLLVPVTLAKAPGP